MTYMIGAIPWVTLIWYFKRGKKTNNIIMVVMITYIVIWLIPMAQWLQSNDTAKILATAVKNVTGMFL